MRYYLAENTVWMKQGNSPVSQADMEVDTYLRETLLRRAPAYGWLSEETADDPAWLDRDLSSSSIRSTARAVFWKATRTGACAFP